MKGKGSKKKSLADDIDALISSTKPKSVDIDDEYGDFASRFPYQDNDSGQEEEEGEDFEARGKRLRLRADIDLDDDDDDKYKKIYSGKKASRSQLFEEEDDGDEEEDDDEDGMGEMDEGSVEEGSDGEGFGGNNDTTEDDDEDDDDDDDDDDGEEESEEEDDDDDDDNATLKLLNREDAAFSNKSEVSSIDIQRGKETRNQKNLLGDMLETRISIQRLMTLSNVLPQSHSFESFKSQDKKSMKAVADTTAAIKGVLDSLLDIRDMSIDANASLKDAVNAAVDEGAPASSRKRKRSETLDVEDYWEEVAGGYERLNPFVDAVLQRWSDRVSISNGKSNVKKFKALNNSILSQVDLAMSDPKRIDRKAHTVRSTYSVMGSDDKDKTTVSESRNGNGKAEQEMDFEVYDDADFYHQLLKEFIQSTTDGEGTNVLQFKYPKSKKKVDTKASKGRKIRYHVHPKILNFMAPEPAPSCSIDVDELFSSIFGNRKGSVMQ